MNLLSKLHKNSILTGPVESFCLACGLLLQSEEESYAHINLPHHVDKLHALSHLDGYKDDCILKIKEGYFCPYCNITLPTIKRISLHVVDSQHREHKISQSITRHGDAIFVSDIVLISPRAWHGVDGATCTVCNQDYSDEEEHTAHPAHGLRLTQARNELGDNFVYRNVDEDLFFCLICSEILFITNKETHHESEKHLELYEKSTEGTVIKNKQLIELNNNIVTKIHETEPLDTVAKTIIECLDNNKPEAEVVEEDYGKSRVVDDNRATTVTNSQSIDPCKTPTKSEKLKGVDFKVTQITAVNIQEIKNNVQPNNSVSLTKATVEHTNDNKQKENKESNFYKLLESRNFVIKTNIDSAYCSICDAPVDSVDVVFHCSNQHHVILNKKHSIRKNKLSENKATEDSPKENCVNDNEKSAPITGIIKVTKSIEIENSEAIKHIEEESKSEVEVNNQKPVLIDSQTEQNDNLAPAHKENEHAPGSKISKRVSKKSQKANKKAKNNNKGRAELPSIASSDIPPVDITNNISNSRSEERCSRISNVCGALQTSQELDAAVTQCEIVDANKPTEPNPIETVFAESEIVKTNTETSTTKEAKTAIVSNTEMIDGLKTEKLSTFIKTVSQVNSSKDVVVNSKFAVGNLSFGFLMRSGDKFECAACNEIVTVDILKHIFSEKHKLNVADCGVVTSLADEFIRQLKWGTYHCGYCNAVLRDWSAARAHLGSRRHAAARTAALWRLQRYLPLLRRAPTKV